jgi:hypothetical protein
VDGISFEVDQAKANLLIEHAFQKRHAGAGLPLNMASALGVMARLLEMPRRPKMPRRLDAKIRAPVLLPIPLGCPESLNRQAVGREAGVLVVDQVSTASWAALQSCSDSNRVTASPPWDGCGS